MGAAQTERITSRNKAGLGRIYLKTFEFPVWLVSGINQIRQHALRNRAGFFRNLQRFAVDVSAL
jgi:hypothetical protein